MPIIDTTINQYIDAELIRLNEEREAEHESSGKLSASMLYQPVRFQVLKTLGAPRKEFDAYTLAKFKRGRDVEDWYVEQLRGASVLVEPKSKDGQDLTEYRGCIGYIDSVIDTDKMQAKVGIIPNEIKSVTNMKIKRIKKTGIDWHYKIQAALYALSMGTEHYAVTIVSSEDLRSDMQIFNTREMKQDVDKAIGKYDIAMSKFKKDRTLPAFEANEHVKWTGNIKYAMYDTMWVEAPDSKVLEMLDEKEKNEKNMEGHSGV